MIFLRKIKASAMQFAILVSVIIAVLLGSFLTLTQTHRFFNTQSKLFLNTIEASNLGIQYGLQAKHTFKDSIILQNGITNTSIKRKYWGGFNMLESTSVTKSKTIKKLALTGSRIPNPNISLYIAENKIPIVLVGSTKIEGTAYLSDKGIKPGSIAGHYFSGKKLIDGEIKYSTGTLPKLNPQWIENTTRLLNFVPSTNDLVVPIREENKNSFFEKTQIIFQRDKITLHEKYIGNIIIKSETEIYVSKYASLTDVTLVAPKIIIEKGFKGSGSFIASDSIKVEENVRLTYPSSLVILQKEVSNNTPKSKVEPPIFISDNSYINGIVVFISEKNKTQSVRTHAKTSIDIQPLATIEGQLYCQGNVALSGTVIGSVYTDRFVTKGFGSIYVNHIYNGKILANDIHPRYCGLPFKDSNNAIVKWLY